MMMFFSRFGMLVAGARRRAVLLAATVAACMAASLGVTAAASADPTNNPHAVSAPFICGDGVGPVTLLILVTHNGTSAAFTGTTRVGIAVTGSPGVPNSPLQTTTCTGTVNGRQITVTAFFTPPTT